MNTSCGFFILYVCCTRSPNINAVFSVFVISKAAIKSEGLICAVYSDPGFKVPSNSLFKEVRFSLETNRLHPFERAPNPVVAIASKAEEEPIGTKFDVIAHHARVHLNQLDGESVDDKFHFNFNRATYDFSDARGWELV